MFPIADAAQLVMQGLMNTSGRRIKVCEASAGYRIRWRRRSPWRYSIASSTTRLIVSITGESFRLKDKRKAGLLGATSKTTKR
jgi:hypothetical protein